MSYLGEFGETFSSRRAATLTTDNIPVLTRLRSWKYGLESPFKADVYFLNTRLFTGNKWGTTNPVMMPDDDLGVVRVRAFGTYDFKIVDPRTFLREVAGSDHDFSVGVFIDVIGSRLVSAFRDAVAAAGIPVLQIASRYRDRRRAAAGHQSRHGRSTVCTSPASSSKTCRCRPKRAAIDKRSSMAAVAT